MILTLIICGLLICVVGHLILKRSERALSSEQRAVVINASVSNGHWFLIGLLALVVSYAIVAQYIEDGRWLLTGFFGIMLLLGIALRIAHFRRLARTGLPSAYLQSNRFDIWLYTFGITVAFAAMLFREWTRVHN